MVDIEKLKKGLENSEKTLKNLNNLAKYPYFSTFWGWGEETSKKNTKKPSKYPYLSKSISKRKEPFWYFYAFLLCTDSKP